MDWYDKLDWVAQSKYGKILGADDLVWVIKADELNSSNTGNQSVRTDLDHIFDKKYKVHSTDLDNAFEVWTISDNSPDFDIEM